MLARHDQLAIRPKHGPSIFTVHFIF
uniref:Uncharacterized protein n=1 Tax=Arundo donax TaxID=35708 RepID=A0A0A9AUV6_ARUDO